MNIPIPTRKPTSADMNSSNGFWDNVGGFLGSIGGRALEVFEDDRMHKREIQMLKTSKELEMQNTVDNQSLSTVASSYIPQGLDVQKAGLALGALALGAFVIKKL